MSLQIFQQLTGGFQSIATIIAVIVGGIWTYRLFVQREKGIPRIEFTVDIAFVGKQGDQWLVELLAFVENKGLVQHTASNFNFDVRCLLESDQIKEGDERIDFQINIPHKLKEGSWLPLEWKATRIDPGLKTRYSYVYAIPTSATFVLLHGRFTYANNILHTADKLIYVPREMGLVSIT